MHFLRERCDKLVKRGFLSALGKEGMCTCLGDLVWTLV